MSLLGCRMPPRLGKAALKTRALQTLARGPLTRPRAKRLECVRFIGTFTPARAASGSWSRCIRKKRREGATYAAPSIDRCLKHEPRRTALRLRLLCARRQYHGPD